MNRFLKLCHKNPVAVWITILFILFIVLDYFVVLFHQPAGMHFFRQTDSLSFVLHYLQNGLDFFSPGSMNQGYSEGHAAAEFPILYYISALLSKLFGFQPFYLRLLNLVIFSVGFTYLFRLLFSYLNKLYYALILSGLVLSSTVLLYYANNFIPDTPALGFCLIAMYFSWKYMTEENRNRFLWPMLIFFTLACLLKVTFCVYPFAFLATLFIKHLSKKQPLLKFVQVESRLLAAYLAFIAVVALWYGYAIWYNNQYQSTLFNTKPWPIWNMSASEIATVWEYMSHYWDATYYYQTAKHLLWALTIAGLIPMLKSNKMWIFASLSVLSALTYIAFFFFSFRDHDYYFIVLIPAIALISASGVRNLIIIFPRAMKTVFPGILLATIAILSLNYGNKKLHERYTHAMDMFSEPAIRVYESADYINSLIEKPEAKVMVLGDRTPNGSLYFLNRQGWTIPDTSADDFINIQKITALGAEYLIVADSTLLQSKSLEPYKHHLLGSKSAVTVFRL